MPQKKKLDGSSMPMERHTRIAKAVLTSEHLRKAPSAVTRIVRVVRARNKLKKSKYAVKHGDAEARNP